MSAAAAGAAVGTAAADGEAHRRFLEALGKSIGVIGASEIGDKTFFIAAIMAMRHARLTVRPPPTPASARPRPAPRPAADPPRALPLRCFRAPCPPSR